MVWIGWAGGALLAVGVAVYLIGLALPESHVARGDVLVPAPVDRVAARIRDVEHQPEWRKGVTAITDVMRDGAALRYVEVARSDRTAFRLTEDVPARRFTSTIDDPALPYSGQWAISLTPRGDSTFVEIEERGAVRNPLFRFVSTVIIGHQRTLRAWLDDLARAEAQPKG